MKILELRYLITKIKTMDKFNRIIERTKESVSLKMKQ